MGLMECSLAGKGSLGNSDNDEHGNDNFYDREARDDVCGILRL